MKTVGELRKALEHYTDDAEILFDGQTDRNYQEIENIVKVSSPNNPTKLVIVELKP